MAIESDVDMSIKYASRDVVDSVEKLELILHAG